MQPIDLAPEQLATLQAILAAHVPECEVRAFGSRVRFTAQAASDLDLALMTERPLDPVRLAGLREAMAESALPFEVDLVDWAATAESFRARIAAESALFRRATSRAQPPAAWQRVPLADLVVIHAGYRARSADLTDEGLPLARARHLHNGFDWRGAQRLSVTDSARLARWLGRAGDVVLLPEAPSPVVALVPAHLEPFVCAAPLCIWRAHGAAVDPGWLFHWMHSPEFRGQCAALAVDDGTAFRVSVSAQRGMFITLPPLLEQRAVAAVLDAPRVRRAVLRRRRTALLKLARLHRDERRALPLVARLLQGLRAQRATARSLTALYDALGSRLLSGELRVPRPEERLARHA